MKDKNATDFIPLLGLSSVEERVKSTLVAYGIKKAPKISPIDFHAYAPIKQCGLEFIFIDEAHIPPKAKTKSYEKKSLVLVTVSFDSGRDGTKKPFTGVLPNGLSFELDLAGVIKKLGKPAWKSKDIANVRWDLKNHSIMIGFDNEYREIYEISIQHLKLIPK